MVLQKDIKLIISRIMYDMAEAIKAADNNMLRIDDALIAAATPAVLLDFKYIDDRQLTRIMVSLKRFFKRNQRFLDFKKSAVAKGLRLEWLPTLEDDDKAAMLSDFILTPAISEDGYVIFNPTVFANLTRGKNPDRSTYGKSDYVARPARKSAAKREKVLLTSVEPDPELAEKLSSYINWYKDNWQWMQKHEAYKWEAVRHFRESFNLEAEDLATNIKESFSKAGNLLSGAMYTPLSMLVKHAGLYPEDVRLALRNLSDESKSLTERSDNFLADIAEIHKRTIEAGHLRTTDTHQQSVRSISVYLGFMHPEKHYLFKSSMWYDFVDELNLNYPSLTQFPSKLFGYELIADAIRPILMADEDLMAMLHESQPDDPSDGHLLTQDFFYAVAVHLPYLTNHPKEMQP